MLNSNAGTPLMLPGPSKSSKVTLLPAAGTDLGFSPPGATIPTPLWNNCYVQWYYLITFYIYRALFLLFIFNPA